MDKAAKGEVYSLLVELPEADRKEIVGDIINREEWTPDELEFLIESIERAVIRE